MYSMQQKYYSPAGLPARIPSAYLETSFGLLTTFGLLTSFCFELNSFALKVYGRRANVAGCGRYEPTPRKIAQDDSQCEYTGTRYNEATQNTFGNGRHLILSCSKLAMRQKLNTLFVTRVFLYRTKRRNLQKPLL